jgi:hypothetical protein
MDLSSGCISRVLQLMNREQLELGRRILLVDSILTKSLCDASGLRRSLAFAARLVSQILGGDQALFPSALVFSLHLPLSQHFITLLLHALKKKLLVYDSLSTSESTKQTCAKLAKAFGLQEDDVEHREMVQQAERPPTECGIFTVATMNGLRHEISPKKVGDSP